MIREQSRRSPGPFQAAFAIADKLPPSSSACKCRHERANRAGQAFCSALSNTLCSTNPCATCPNRPSPLAREIVTSSTSLPAIDSPGIALKRQDSSARDEVPAAMVPCSDACQSFFPGLDSTLHPIEGYQNADEGPLPIPILAIKHSVYTGLLFLSSSSLQGRPCASIQTLALRTSICSLT